MKQIGAVFEGGFSDVLQGKLEIVVDVEVLSHFGLIELVEVGLFLVNLRQINPGWFFNALHKVLDKAFAVGKLRIYYHLFHKLPLAVFIIVVFNHSRFFFLEKLFKVNKAINVTAHSLTIIKISLVMLNRLIIKVLLLKSNLLYLKSILLVK